MEDGRGRVEGSTDALAVGAGGDEGCNVTAHTMPPVGGGEQLGGAFNAKMTSQVVLGLDEGLAGRRRGDLTGGTIREVFEQKVTQNEVELGTFQDATAGDGGEVLREQAGAQKIKHRKVRPNVLGI